MNNQNLFVDYSNIPPNNYLILVLESPHISEYDSNQNAYGPAQGKTGCNICDYLEDCLNNPDSNIILNTDIRYKLVIVNAIQFQCSLGFSPINQTTRDSTWSLLIKDANYNDIGERLKRFLSSNQDCVIVNCCTKDLKDDLDEAIKFVKINNYCYGHHPSCWWSPALRKIWRGVYGN